MKLLSFAEKYDVAVDHLISDFKTMRGLTDEASSDPNNEDATGVVGYSAVFAEVQLNDMFGIGIDYVPGDLTSETAETTLDDLKGSGDGASSKSTNSVALSFEDITQIYATLNLGENLYVKAGILTVDVITNESMGATSSKYGDATLDGTFGSIGYAYDTGYGVIVRAEAGFNEYDNMSVKSEGGDGTANTVKLEGLDGPTLGLSIVKEF